MAWPAAVLPCFISRFLYRPQKEKGPDFHGTSHSRSLSVLAIQGQMWHISWMEQAQELLSIAEAAQLLRVSTRTIARLIADGQLHAPKIRRRRLVSMASITGLLKAMH